MFTRSSSADKPTNSQPKESSLVYTTVLAHECQAAKWVLICSPKTFSSAISMRETELSKTRWPIDRYSTRSYCIHVRGVCCSMRPIAKPELVAKALKLEHLVANRHLSPRTSNGWNTASPVRSPTPFLHSPTGFTKTADGLAGETGSEQKISITRTGNFCLSRKFKKLCEG
jgi:hypothetical protein